MNMPNAVVWNTPSRDSSGSMPLGNGDIGLNVWVEEEGDLLFYLSKTDAWDENARLLKLGRVRVSLTPNPFTAGADFRQELDLATGTIRISAVPVNAIFVDATPPSRVKLSGGGAASTTGAKRLGGIRLLPAWPKEWNVEFRLHAPGRTVVEGRIENGEVRELRVTPESRRNDVLHAV
jgi:hypothetical protein